MKLKIISLSLLATAVWAQCTGTPDPRVWRGTYAGGTAYTLCDVTYYSGSAYLSVQPANTGHQPDTSATWWTVIYSAPVDLQATEPLKGSHIALDYNLAWQRANAALKAPLDSPAFTGPATFAGPVLVGTTLPVAPGSPCNQGGIWAANSKIVTPQMCGAVADGTHDDYAAIIAALDTGLQVDLPVGVYAYGTPIVRTDAVRLIGRGRTSRFKYIGIATTDAIKLDYSGGQTASRLEDFQIDGNGLVVNGLHTIGSVHNVYRNLEVRNVSGIAMWGEGSTSDVLDHITVSPQSSLEDFTMIPEVGIKVSNLSGGVHISDPRIEGVVNGAGIGISLAYCVTCVVSTGTSEGNKVGIDIGISTANTVITGIDLESNSVSDLNIIGSQNSYNGIMSASSGGIVVNANGRNNTFHGGRATNFTINSVDAYSTQIYGMTLYNAISDSGTNTFALGLFNPNTALPWPDIPWGGAWTVTNPTPTCSTGTPTVLTAEVHSKVNGKTDSLSIRLTDTSNGTCAGAIYVSVPVAVLQDSVLMCRELTNTGVMGFASITAGSTTATLLNYLQTTYAATSNTVACSGVVELQ